MIDSLEPRRLLTASLSAGVLTITGTPAGDSLIAEVDKKNLKVIENGTKISSFKLDKVSYIVFNGVAGNDTLTNKSIKPSIMNGGLGDDLMIGSPTVSDQFSGGDGTDTVSYAARTQNLRLRIGAASGANNGDEGDFLDFDLERYVGGSGNDDITGLSNRELLEGGPGNDTLRGVDGSDALIGGPGNDVLDGSADAALMDGGPGDDRFIVSPRATVTIFTITDSDGIDTLDFSQSFTKIDIDMALDAGQLQDLNGDASAALKGVFENIFGGPFTNRLRGNAVANRMVGGTGNFTNTLEGRGGNDWLTGGHVRDHLIGGNDDDLLDGVSTDKDGDDFLDGGPGFDTLDLSNRSADLDITIGSTVANESNDGEGTEGDEVKRVEHVIGGGGNDRILLGDDADFAAHYWFEGRQGNDGLVNFSDEGNHDPGTSDCTMQGGDGNDQVGGGLGNDLIEGGGENDFLTGADGNDVLDGGAGNDSALGGKGNDLIDGGAGDDVLSGEEGNDVITGGLGSDRLLGGEGDDRLIANDGVSDTLDGGSGGELFGDTAMTDSALDVVSTCENVIASRPARGAMA